MARIPQDVIDTIKREVSLQRVAESYGVELQKHGSDLIARCPMHNDRTPSFVITPAKNLWNCLGACQQGGSVIDFVMKMEKLSFRHAALKLRDGFEPTQTKAKDSSSDSETKALSAKRLGSQTKADSSLAAISSRGVNPDSGSLSELRNEVINLYSQTLKQSPEAIEYLKKRGLLGPEHQCTEVIDTFKLGFANRTLGYKLPSKNSTAGKAIRAKLQKVGILRKTGHEQFNGSLVIPVFDTSGNVVEIYGRKVGGRLTKGTPLHLYMNGPHAGVWNYQTALAGEEVILCEALIDSLTFWVNGFKNVTSSYGINGWTPEHLQAFKDNNIKRVLIAYDRDDAGNKAAASLAKELMAEGVECFRVNFPKGMDVNLYAQKMQPAPKALGLILRSSEWMGSGKPPVTKPKVETATATEATKRKTGTAAAKEKNKPDSSLVADEVPETKALSSIDSEPVEAQSSLAASSPKAQLVNPDSGSVGSPVTPVPTSAVAVERREGEVVLNIGHRKYRVRGLEQNSSYSILKINLMVSIGDPAKADEVHKFHVDTLDLYQSKLRASYIRQAAEELRLTEDVLKSDIGKLLRTLEEIQADNLRQILEPEDASPQMSEAEKTQALQLLRDPNLINRILQDFERSGVTGEATNKLLGYIATVSRMLDAPLAVIVQSSSAAGKSSLMEAVLKFMPPEECIKYSALTGQSLFYMGETNLKHKVLAVAEGEGADKAFYALKLLQSEGELTIASTGKDPNSGRMTTEVYRVEGPVMLFLTTTAAEIDEELLNRCVVLTVDEDRKQTRAIHALQRESQTLEGLLTKKSRQDVLKLHRNAQRLLKPVAVVNPYANKLTFTDSRTRTRRDHMKYLTLIRTITLLHQYQRPTKTVKASADNEAAPTLSYIEVTPEDIELANKLAHEVLGRSLDELPPQSRRLLAMIENMVSERCKAEGIERKLCMFSRRTIRNHSGWSDYQVRTHLGKLVELEYILTHRGRRGQSFVYELLFDGQANDSTPKLSGLIDAQTLGAGTSSRPVNPDSGYDAEESNSEAKSHNTLNENNKIGQSSRAETESSRGQSGPIEGSSRVSLIVAKAAK